MNREDNIEMARNLTTAMIKLINDSQLDREDAVAVISTAFSETLAHLLDPLEAIERLRLTADIYERQFLDGHLNWQRKY